MKYFSLLWNNFIFTQNKKIIRCFINTSFISIAEKNCNIKFYTVTEVNSIIAKFEFFFIVTQHKKIILALLTRISHQYYKKLLCQIFHSYRGALNISPKLFSTLRIRSPCSQQFFYLPLWGSILHVISEETVF